LRLVAACVAFAALPVASAGAITYERIADVNPGFGSGGAGDLTVYDGNLYFIANDVPHGRNSELWRYDGSVTAKAAEIRPGPEGSGINSLTVYDGKLYFSARDDDGTQELWSYDASSGVAAEVPDNNPAWNPQTHTELTVFDGDLYFRAAHFDTVGIELGRYDGSTQHAIDLWPGPGTSLPQQFAEYRGGLYFSAGTVAGDGGELTRLDADKMGATRVANINQVSGGSSPAHAAVYDDALYFSAYDGVHGTELWRYRPGDSPEARLVADLQGPGQYVSGGPAGMTVFDGKLYFSADDGVHGAELWRYNSATGVAELFWNINENLPPAGGEDPEHHAWPSGLFVHNGLMVFAADDGVHGRELWATDGETAWMMLDLFPGPYGSGVGGFAVYNEQLYFTANDGRTGSELYSESTAVFQLVPEPSTFVLLSVGAVGLLVCARWRRFFVGS